MKLTHLDEKNRPKMVDVSDKAITKREAVASWRLSISICISTICPKPSMAIV